MNIKHALSVIALCLMASLAWHTTPANAAEQIKINEEEIKKVLPIGENLVYNIRWTGIPAGKTTLNIVSIVEIDGHPCYHIKARTRSNKFVSTFYPVDDTIETYIDVKTFQPRKFVKKLNEGKSKRDQYSLFMPDKKKVEHYSIRDDGTFGKDAENQLVGPTQDAMSALYYFRTYKKFQEGDALPINVNADEKNWKLTVNIQKKTKVKLWGLGKFWAYKVKPVVNFEGMFIKKGDMTVYIDENWGIPLKMSVAVPIGAISVTLDKVENSNLFIR